MNFHHLSPSEFLIKINELMDWDNRITRVTQICGDSLIVACEDNLLRSVTFQGQWIWLDTYADEFYDIEPIPEFTLV
jgi:hypothetical protein